MNSLAELLDADVVAAAQRLLGCHLVFGELRAAIAETEAYRSEDDPASHAYRGETPRNRIMFRESGHAYVYFNYGVHWMLNVTAHEPGRAAGILVRAAMPIEGIDEMRARRTGKMRSVKDRDLLSGPGKLAQAFDITGEQNGLYLLDPTGAFRLEEKEPRPFLATMRVGLAKGKGDEIPWRFIDSERVEWASSPRPHQK